MEPLSTLLTPFWRGPHMTREPLLFIGSPASPCSARLFHQPLTDVAISDPTRQSCYLRDDDYVVDVTSGLIVRPPGSRIPILAADDTSQLDPDLLHARTVTADYEHAGEERFDGVPANKSHQLPGTTAAWLAGEPLDIWVVGDSISVGYDASGFRNVRPFQPSYVELVCHALGRACGSPVSMHNFAVAGWTTDDALWQLPEITRGGSTLVIVAFGMNDATYAEAQGFAERIAAMTQQLSAGSTNAEFVIVTPMLPSPACTWVDAGRLEHYRQAVLGLERPGLAVADVTAVWRSVLRRKHILELSGNGTNHPNDFGHRIYAQTVLATLGIPGAC